MQIPQPPATLADRIAHCIAFAQAHLTHWMPFTIVSALPDAGDGLTCCVVVRMDDGSEMHGIFAMQFLSPAAVAEAATRAYLAYTRGLDVWDGTEDDIVPDPLAKTGYIQ